MQTRLFSWKGGPCRPLHKIKQRKKQMKLYIGNLAFNTKEQEVREMLEQYGELESFDWITDRYTGKARGFCFAEMNNSDADTLIKAMNGKDFGGRVIKINEARAKSSRKKRRSW